MRESSPEDPGKQYADWKAPKGEGDTKKESTMGVIESIEEISPEEADRLDTVAKYNPEVNRLRKEIPQISPESLLNRLSKYIPDNKQYKGEKDIFFKKESEWRKYMTSVVGDFAFAVSDAIEQSVRKDGVPVVDFDINEFQFNGIDKESRRIFNKNFSNEAEEELVTELKRIRTGD